MSVMARTSLSSPFGMLSLFEDDGNLVALEWGQTADKQPSALLEEAGLQLNAYFDGDLKEFDLPLAPDGTSFQRAVWDQLRRIPFGAVQAYADIAEAVGNAPRAVGGACGRNPIPIIIPCHRVIGKDGRLGGFSGYAGIKTKRRLFRLEGVSIT